jgi:ATP-binding cassette, subfamily F, member 3
MLQLTGAGKRFGHKLLFEDLDWLITPKERAGLVGGNGTGKSTLLKIIAGLEQLDYGSLSAMKGIRIGYLPQDGLQISGRTVFAERLHSPVQLRTGRNGRNRRSNLSLGTSNR